MPRNLDKRVEVVYPILNPALRKAVIETILPVQLGDNVKVRLMQPDGTYARITPGPSEESVNAQSWLVEHRGIWYDRHS